MSQTIPITPFACPHCGITKSSCRPGPLEQKHEPMPGDIGLCESCEGVFLYNGPGAAIAIEEEGLDEFHSLQLLMVRVALSLRRQAHQARMN